MEPQENEELDKIIEAAVAEATVDMSPEEKKECERMMFDVIKEGQTFAEALGLGEDQLEGFYSVGYLLFNSGKYKQAENIFEVLTRLDGSRWKHWYGLAACKHKLKKYERAIECYLSWAYLEPESPIPLFHASDCYIALNQKREAVLLLYTVIELCGDTPIYQKIKQKAINTFEGLKEQVGWEEPPKE
jgi:type III secretion system low calcium response chaperone LcrH/SycD